MTEADKGNSREDNPGTPADAEGQAGRKGVPLQANFLQFLSGMAAQTLMHLGAMTNPITGATETDLAQAKYSIDLLTLLQEKTKGNLEDDEERYIQAALTDLRLRYVEASKPSSDSAPQTGEEKTDSGDAQPA